jgi:GTP-binding protein
LRAIERAEAAVVVVDAVEGMTDQDARIADHAWERGRAVVVVVNKCDLIGGTVRAARVIGPAAEQRYHFLATVPMVFISARSGEGMDRILPGVERVVANHRRRIPTPRLNLVISNAVRETAPPSVRGKRPTFQYAVQTAVRPPMVTIFCSAPELVTTAYSRYLVNRLRSAFEFNGSPIRLSFRSRRRQRGSGSGASTRSRRSTSGVKAER